MDTSSDTTPDTGDSSPEQAPAADTAAHQPRAWSTRTLIVTAVIAVALGASAGTAVGALADDSGSGRVGPRDGFPGQQFRHHGPGETQDGQDRGDRQRPGRRLPDQQGRPSQQGTDRGATSTL